MKITKNKYLAYIMVAVMMLFTFLPYMVDVQVAEAARGTKMATSSFKTSTTAASDLKAPQVGNIASGTHFGLNNIKKKIFPKDYNKYYGRNLPMHLVTSGGNNLIALCMQSYIDAPKSTSATGTVTDPRILELINVVSYGKDPQTMSQAQHIALQLVMWSALNNNWRADLFSGGWIVPDGSFYYSKEGAMSGVPQHLKTVAAEWGKIINASEGKQFGIQPSKKEFTGACNLEQQKAVVEIEWEAIGGGSGIGNIADVADVTFSNLPAGARVVHTSTPGVWTELTNLKVKPKANSHYIIIDNVTGSGSADIKATIKYKGNYAKLNNATAITYGTTSSSTQPFIVPVQTRKSFDIKIKWECEPLDERTPDPNTQTNSTELRWYNMPSAFGEIKDGKGYNEKGVTLEGKYALTRNEEEFEAMLGVPNTERLYVNLGGTEGFIDVTYTLETLSQPFTVNWNTPWYYYYSCGTSEHPATCTASGTESFSKTFNWQFTALHLKEATFRVFGDGSVNQDELEYTLEIVNTAKETGSFSLAPNPAGLEVGPGAGSSTYNIGAENSWSPSQGTFTTSTVSGRVATESDGKGEAFAQGNANVGNIFAQNDKLEITIKGTTYTFVPEVNKQSSVPFTEGGTYILDATNGERNQYFTPVKEKWDVWSKVPIQGYTGNPEDNDKRSVKGTPILLEDLPMKTTSLNGIYEFETTESGNTLDYEEAVTTIKGSTKDIHKSVDELSDGNGTGTGVVYESAQDPTNPDYYAEDNKVWLQYTNWQVPVTDSKLGFQFKHSGNEPDGVADESLDDNPRYRSINPILVHNPTTTLYTWVSDIPDAQLQDQRINGQDERIVKYDRATQADGNARNYIDFDLQITMPNVAAFETYWNQKAKNSNAEGFEDLDFTEPGTLGKGYEGNAMAQVNTRSYESPYKNATGWDVSKWTTAKYIKFPYNVYYYKNSGEIGGDMAGFYSAGTWIKLYDDNKTVKSGDPTVFNFHIASDQKDVKDGIIYVVAETINSADDVAGNPEALYLSGEQYVNGTRKPKDSNVGSHFNTHDGEATYSTTNQVNVDVIGRIGNLLVSDTTDPAWASVFWETKNGKIDTTKPVSKDYGMYYNIYDSLVEPTTLFKAYDRYSTIEEWHGQKSPIQTLPLTTNKAVKGKEDQTVKLGYNVGGSIQTIGDYDYEMWIYPQNQLAGSFTTGNPSQDFKLMTSDPFSPGAKYQEYYDSNVNNTLHGKTGVIGKDYTPRYQHLLSASLADPRMKISAWEKATPSYQKAVQLGSSKKIYIGTPSWMVITQNLRTLIGSDDTQGKWGAPLVNGNDPTGARQDAGSANCPGSCENVQKWNWNYSLPQNTNIWFEQQTNANGSPVFEKPSKDQYIITSMTFRTKANRTTMPGVKDEWQTEIKQPAIGADNMYQVDTPQSTPDWDLTMYTNKGVNTLPDLEKSTTNVPDGFTPSKDPSIPNTWDPSQEGDISRPMIDIIWWNYSKQSTTDKDNIGTH